MLERVKTMIAKYNQNGDGKLQFKEVTTASHNQSLMVWVTVCGYDTFWALLDAVWPAL